MKLRIPRRRPSVSLAVAVLALFVALGGSSYAALRITGKDVKDGSLTGKDVKNGSLTNKDVNQSKLGQLRTVSAYAQSTSPQQLTNDGRTVLNKTIKLPSARRITAVASIQAQTASGTGSTDQVTCNLRIDNIDGVSQETDITGTSSTAFESVTVNQQSSSLPKGQHSVVVECSQGTTSNVQVTDRSLSIVATG